jgi:hypothetical protein
MQLMESGAVTDPSLIEKQQKGYIADTAVDRGDEEAILAYVRQKYDRTELLTFKPKKISVAVKINYEGLAGR